MSPAAARGGRVGDPSSHAVPSCCPLQALLHKPPQRGAPLHHPARGRAEIAHSGIITHTQIAHRQDKQRVTFIQRCRRAKDAAQIPKDEVETFKEGRALALGQIMPSGTAGQAQLRVLPAAHTRVLFQCFIPFALAALSTLCAHMSHSYLQKVRQMTKTKLAQRQTRFFSH